MPSTAMPGRHLVGELEQLRVGRAELRAATAYVVGQQQLAARRRPQSLHRLQGALVGDREGADLLDLVAPELHPQRVLLGRRRRRRRCRRAPRTRRAAPPCRRGSTPPPRGRGRRRRATGSPPARARRARCRPGRAPAAGAGSGSGATTTRSGPLEASVPGWRRRRRTASRRPTVSLRGLSRSCGSVSQLGSRRPSPGRRGRPAPPPGPRPPATSPSPPGRCARAATRPCTTKGRTAAGPVRSSVDCTAPSASAAPRVGADVRRSATATSGEDGTGSDPSGARRQTPIRDRVGGV